MKFGNNESHLNEHYGTGRFQRRIRLVNTPDRVLCELEDCSHGFKVDVVHSEGQITELAPQVIRHPLSTCGGAVEPLKKFIGLSTGQTTIDYYSQVKPKLNCTHLYDLTALGATHAGRDEQERLYDIIVPDELDGGTTITIQLNGKTIFEWQVSEWAMAAPEHLKGKPLHSGFLHWVLREYEDDQEMLACALMAQKAYLVSQARRFNKAMGEGKSAASNPAMQGACYSYQPGVIEGATFLSSFRDFTGVEEQLLKFEA